MRTFFGWTIQLVTALAVVMTMSWQGISFGQQQDIRLEVGREQRHELKASETHSYRFTLQPGEFIHLVVTQNGTNALMSVSDPAGQVLEAKSPSERHGANQLWFVAESAGEHLIRLSSKNAGSYSIQLSEKRAATATDRHRHTAQRLWHQSEQLKQKGTRQDKQSAIALEHEAVQHWREAADREMEAVGLYRIASLHHDSQELKEAIPLYNQVIPMFRSSGNKFLLANALVELGDCLTFTSDQQTAEPPLLEAIAFSKELQEPALEAWGVNFMGNVYALAGDLKSSGKYYSQSAELARQHGLSRIEGSVYNNWGDDFVILGQYEKAEEWFQRGLSLIQSATDPGMEALLHLNLARVSTYLAKEENAERSGLKSLEISKATGNRQPEAGSNMLLATLYRNKKLYEKSAYHSNQALAVAREMGNRYKQVDILASLGGTYRRDNKRQLALDALNQSLALSRELKMPFWEYQSLHELAHVEAQSGNLAEAHAYIETALAVVESLRASLVVYEMRNSFVGTVQDAYQLQVEILMRRHQQTPNAGYAARALLASERGRAQGLVEMLEEARADIRKGVDPQLLKREDELQSQISSKSEEQLALGTGSANQAKAAEVQKAIEALKAELTKVETAIRTQSPQYAALTKPQPISLNEIQTKLLDDDTLFLEYSLGEKQSWLWAVTKSSFNSYKLPAKAEIEKSALKLYELLRQSDTGRAGTAKSAVETATAAGALSDLVLKPVASQLGTRKLLIAADGALQYVPFSALPEPIPNSKSSVTRPPLVVKHTVMVTPSATTLSVLREGNSKRASAPKIIAAFADPVFGRYDDRVANALRQPNNLAPAGSATLEQLERAVRVGESGLLLPRLPHSQTEADAIVENVPKDQALVATGFRATRELAMSETLKEFRFVHFATHGIFNTQRPDLSGLFFSTVNERGGAQKGFLGIGEVYGMTLPADLVVLSACETGLGKQIKGEGMVGLTRGFMYAGARRVVASLWKVNDAATAELMKRFYQGMLGSKKLSPAAALREAQVSMWKEKRWQSPYYWAAFVLQGE